MKRKFAIRAFLRSELDDPNRRVSDLPRPSTKSLTSVLYLENSPARAVCSVGGLVYPELRSGAAFSACSTTTRPRRQGAASIRRIQLPVRPARFPPTPHHPIKVHAFCLQPSLQRLPS